MDDYGFATRVPALKLGSWRFTGSAVSRTGRLGAVQRGIQQIQFPLEYRAELLGEYAERLAAQREVELVVASEPELLKALTNFGQPYITVADANYANRGELLPVGSFGHTGFTGTSVHCVGLTLRTSSSKSGRGSPSMLYSTCGDALNSSATS